MPNLVIPCLVVLPKFKGSKLVLYHPVPYYTCVHTENSSRVVKLIIKIYTIEGFFFAKIWSFLGVSVPVDFFLFYIMMVYNDAYNICKNWLQQRGGTYTS